MKIIFRPVKGLEILPIALGGFLVVVSFSLTQLWPIAIILLLYGLGAYIVNNLPKLSFLDSWIPLKDKSLQVSFSLNELIVWNKRAKELKDPVLREVLHKALSSVSEIRFQYQHLEPQRQQFWERYLTEADKALDLVWRALSRAMVVKTANATAFQELLQAASSALSEVESFSQKMAEATTDIDLTAISRGLADSQAARELLEDRISLLKEVQMYERSK
ncbi:hypothetical protein M1116_03490 [Patescibacteria group bacterium]|nr:hypothetical protein [Patescibacteria group bacterium]